MPKRSIYIGITCDFEDDSSKGESKSFIENRYIEAISDAGGIPVLLPPAGCNEQILSLFEDICHGLVIAGGDFDIPPEQYGESPIKKLGRIIPERTDLELNLLRKATTLGIPMLGICGGHQLINVAFGGTLYQDITSQCFHSINHCPGERFFTHAVTLKPSTRLLNILGEERIEVNSTHHQAIRTVASGFVVSACSDDGIIESIELKGDRFIVGVQWHPEAIRKKNRLFDRLFIRLMYEANQYAAKQESEDRSQETT